MADDLFGGMFDFNGDGKTDLGEQFVAYQIFREVTKDEDEDRDDDPDAELDGDDDPDDLGPDDTYSYSYAPPRRYQPEPPAKTVLYSSALPEKITPAEYRSRRREFWGLCIFLVVVAAALCLIPGAFLWASLETYEPGNSASAFVCGVIGLVCLIVICLILGAAGRALGAELRNLQKAKEACRKYAEDLQK